MPMVIGLKAGYNKIVVSSGTSNP